MFVFIFKLLLMSSLTINSSYSSDPRKEDNSKQLEHAHSFLESFMAGTHSMFSDKNIFGKLKEKMKPKENEENKEVEKETATEQPLIQNVPEVKPPSFNYKQVLRENYHNVKHKAELQEENLLKSKGMEVSTTSTVVENDLGDKSETKTADNFSQGSNDSNDDISTATPDLDDSNVDTEETNQKNNIQENDPVQVIYAEKPSYSATEDLTYVEGEADNWKDVDDWKDMDDLFEKETEAIDHGPIDRSFDDADDFPFPLREKDYFNSKFELSPSYDIRSRYFLTIPSDDPNVGDKTIKQTVYTEERTKRTDKHIFGGVIGGLAGVFGFLASKKLIFAVVIVATLLAMGITGTSPQQLSRAIMPNSPWLNFTLAFSGAGNGTSNSTSRIPKDGSEVEVVQPLEGPMAELYQYASDAAISSIEPIAETVQQASEMWTYFSQGFLTSLGRNFVSSDELILQETPIGDIIKTDVSPIGDIPVDDNPTLSAFEENIIAPLGDIDVSKLSPQIDLFPNDIASLEDVNENKVSSINDLVDNDIARDNHEVSSSLDHLVSNNISRFSDTSEKNPPNLDDLDNNKIVRLINSDENKAPMLEDLVSNDISRSDHIDGDINDDLVKNDISRLDLIEEKIEDSLVDIIEHRIVEPILEYSLSPTIESVENKAATKDVDNENTDPYPEEAKIENDRDQRKTSLWSMFQSMAQPATDQLQKVFEFEKTKEFEAEAEAGGEGSGESEGSGQVESPGQMGAGSSSSQPEASRAQGTSERASGSTTSSGDVTSETTVNKDVNVEVTVDVEKEASTEEGEGEEGEEEGSGEKLLSIEAYYTGDNFEIKKSVTVNMPKPTVIDPKDLLRRHKGPP